jgi:hypothetical protein
VLSTSSEYFATREIPLEHIAYLAEFDNKWSNRNPKAPSSLSEIHALKHSQLSDKEPSDSMVLDEEPPISNSSTPSIKETVSAGVVGDDSVLDVSAGPPLQHVGNETIDSETLYSETCPPNPSSRPSIDQHGRRIIYIDDFDFTTMHNLLYFLYTGYANLHHSPAGENLNEFLEESPPGYPPPADPFTLYTAADMFLVEALKERCYRYLTSTCTTTNICQRLLGTNSCDDYESLKEFYFEFLIRNYNAVKKGKEWKRTILSMNESPPELREYQLMMLLEITRIVSPSQS